MSVLDSFAGKESAVNLPLAECRRGLIETLRANPRPCEIALTARQYSLQIRFDGATIRSFAICQASTSTLWMHFFRPRVIYDSATPVGMEDIAKAEINAAINMFSLLRGACRIETRPFRKSETGTIGLGLGFLEHAASTSNLQEVHPATAQKVVLFNLATTAGPEVSTPSATIISLKDRLRQADPSETALPASVSADDKPLLLVNPAPQSGGYVHRQRLHLS
ncbi:MAG: hypothetical protein KDE08_06475 [Rhodobacteraceae bacterium]|nr:hypothetical protein [Paracoccaceae bacterium]